MQVIFSTKIVESSKKILQTLFRNIQNVFSVSNVNPLSAPASGIWAGFYLGKNEKLYFSDIELFRILPAFYNYLNCHEISNK